MKTKKLINHIATLLICCAFLISGPIFTSDTMAAEKKSKSTGKKETEKKATKTKDKKASSTKSGSTKPVNINKADKEELATLDGIGEERAKDIIAYRKKKGSFKKPEDLMNVNGIGPKIYEKNKKRIKLK